jgi:type IV secretion system protein VirD4
MGWLISSAFFFLIFGSIACLISYRSIGENKERPAESMSFGDYVPVFARQYKGRLIIAALLFLISSILGVIALATIFIKKKEKMKYLTIREMRVMEEDANREWLASLGPNHTVRAQKIDQIFADVTDTMTATYLAEWESWSGQVKVEGYCLINIKRSLAAMDNRDREHLRIVEHLNSAANGTEKKYRLWRTSLIHGDGKGAPNGTYQYSGLSDSDLQRGHATAALEKKSASVSQVISALNQHLFENRHDASLSSDLASVINESFEALSQGGSKWLRSTKVAGTIFEHHGGYALHIGAFDDGIPLTYSGEGSMITIAPPGSGKTQCNVFPNLLTWTGPAVVLDISGDIFENTSKWRSENVGPVYKFSPLEPEASHCYNPLTFVRQEPDFIWEDSRLLAEMMIVPSSSNDPFWENEARTALTAAIAYICYSNPPENRPMHQVLDIMYCGEPWADMLVGLKLAADVRAMMQNGTALAAMNEKTLGSVLQTARSSLSAWAGERIARATARSDWNPADLRDGSNPTIYIYIRPNEVESYLSLLRVFIGQHIRVLTGGNVPPRGSPPILFMLDELPRLRNMPPVDEALNIGRKYGLRLWMFAQSVGQIRESYKNADGMISSCAVRIYMNASGADGLAEKISEEIGTVDSFTDGQKRRVVEAADLAGPGFRDYQIVFGLNTRPAKVQKDFAWKNETLRSRMGAADLP